MNVRGGSLVLFGSLSLALTACSSSSSPAASTPPPLTASVNDAAGDTVIVPVLRDGAIVTPVVPVAPDLVSVAIEVSGGTLTGTIAFAPGTFSHTDSFACLMLDVDENPATGGPSPNGDVPVGYDYSICAVNPRGSTTAQVSRLGGGVTTGIGSVPVTFVTNDSLRFTVPLSLLGNDDGRMAFKVSSMQWIDAPIFNTSPVDWMPDLGRPAALVR